jgi:hypothetical protein
MELSMVADYFYVDIHDDYWEELWNNLPVRAKERK